MQSVSEASSLIEAPFPKPQTLARPLSMYSKGSVWSFVSVERRSEGGHSWIPFWTCPLPLNTPPTFSPLFGFRYDLLPQVIWTIPFVEPYGVSQNWGRAFGCPHKKDGAEGIFQVPLDEDYHAIHIFLGLLITNPLKFSVQLARCEMPQLVTTCCERQKLTPRKP